VKGGKKYRVTYGKAKSFMEAQEEYFRDVLGLKQTKTVLIDGKPHTQPDPVDPRQRQLAPPVPEVGTIREALDLYFMDKLGPNARRKKGKLKGLPLAEKTKANKKSRLERWLGKEHGKRALYGASKITSHEVAAILASSERTGHMGATKLLQRDLSQFFKWCRGRKYIDDLLTGLRKTEVLEATWGEIKWDQKLWIIPRERTKNRLGHVLPLSDLAIAVLRDAQKHSRGIHVLTARRDGRPLQSFGNAWDEHGKRNPGSDSAQARIMELAERELGEPMQPWKTHDLRRTVRSHLKALGVHREIAEAVLNHSPGGLVGTYDRYFPEKEMREALQKWGQKLATLGLVVQPRQLPAPQKLLPAPAA